MLHTGLERQDKALSTDPVVMRSSPATDIYVVHCWLINPNKLNLLFIYLINKVHGNNIYIYDSIFKISYELCNGECQASIKIHL